MYVITIDNITLIMTPLDERVTDYLNDNTNQNSKKRDISPCQRIAFDWQIYTKHHILVIITFLLMFIEIALHSFLLVLQWAAH